MKSSLGKLRKFALHKTDVKEKKEYQPSAHLDELAQAAQDMHNMRNCYDSLLSAAAATANSAYEFSESLREMGACLMEKTALNDDEKSGVLFMLGKVQFELQNYIDSYRSHIFHTVTSPSESLLNELRTVEEMKRQCDEKRTVYEYMMGQQREKGWSKSGRGDNCAAQELQAAHDEYDEEAKLCVFRLKSLKEGQSRSLLTQAARHHAAQLNFFRKGLKSLEAVEPHVKMVAEQHHIDYQFHGLEDDGEGEEGSVEKDLDSSDDGELSFDYRENKKVFDVVSNSMELEQSDVSFRRALVVEDAGVNLDRSHGELQVSSREPKACSHSAPIFAEKKLDPAEKMRQLQSVSARKSHAYVLPTPIGAKSSTPARTSSSAPQARPTSHGGHAHNLWHSTPLEPSRHGKDSGDDNFSGPADLKGQSVLKDGNSTNASTVLPPPLTEGPRLSELNVSSTKKIKRHAFSGPLTSKPMSAKPVLSSSSPIASSELPQIVSGLVSRALVEPPSSSRKASPCASPPPASSPRISELHELPRPPGISTTKAEKPYISTGHSAPLAYRSQEPSTVTKVSPVSSNAPSPLPTPPLTVQRSFSIPSRVHRATTLEVTRLLESPQGPHKSKGVPSPPLTLVSLKNMERQPTIPEVASRSSQMRGGS